MPEQWVIRNVLYDPNLDPKVCRSRLLLTLFIGWWLFVFLLWGLGISSELLARNPKAKLNTSKPPNTEEADDTMQKEPYTLNFCIARGGLGVWFWVSSLGFRV